MFVLAEAHHNIIEKEVDRLNLLKVRHAAARELGKFRAEMARQARDATAACLEVQRREWSSNFVLKEINLKILNFFSSKVYTSSQYVVDSAGQRVCVGSISELWEKLERTKLELKVEEERADAVEEEREAAERKIALLERRLEERMSRERKNDDREEEPGEGLISSRPSSRVGTLEAECGALRSSLQDIASMVAGEVEGRKPRVLVPGRSSLTPRYHIHSNICV